MEDKTLILAGYSIAHKPFMLAKGKLKIEISLYSAADVPCKLCKTLRGGCALCIYTQSMSRQSNFILKVRRTEEQEDQNVR